MPHNSCKPPKKIGRKNKHRRDFKRNKWVNYLTNNIKESKNIVLNNLAYLVLTTIVALRFPDLSG